jgi:extracellular solute-binding protein (family 3)
MWRRRLLNNCPVWSWMSGCCLLCLVLIVSAGCKRETDPPATGGSATTVAAIQPEPSPALQPGDDLELAPNYLPPPTRHVHLPLPRERHTDDLRNMVKRRAIRALVVTDQIGFFYAGGLPRGVMYEGLEQFQKFINKKLNTGTIKVVVTFVPVRLDQLEMALTEGMGDLIAYEVAITQERSRRVAFSMPMREDVE